MIVCVVALVAWMCASAAADSYLQNPRGSNNKLNEQQNNVRNNRRLFDSQNNANSGYQVGDKCIPNCLQPGTNTYDPTIPGAGEGTMEFYEGSELQVEWTNQHGCGINPRVHCNMVLQYGCGDHPDLQGMRDGKTTDRIPNDRSNPSFDLYGQHETPEYWNQCSVRERNKGLFVADQNLNGRDTAIHTRQDTNGNKDRYGFECPEERDYYPYWHPSPWRDVWVCTDEPTRCPYYKAQSQNVVDKGLCSAPQFNNQKACETGGGKWQQQGSYGIDPPDCGICPTTRNNHNGNALGSVDSPSYTMIIPEGVHADGTRCVIRLRYNISNFDYDGWSADKSLNGDNSPVKTNPSSDYLGYGTNVSGPIRLAIDGDQNGRTFEDRTHTFIIRKRPTGSAGWLGNKRIINLNIRGRRGNIQQVYPAVEYDFVPTEIHATQGDYLHIQWTGADSNDQGNDGQGRTGTDRNNLVLVPSLGKNIPINFNPLDLSQRPTHFTDNQSMIAFLSYLAQQDCDINTADTQSPQNCKLLNAAPGYINAGLVPIDNRGVFTYASTRNNRFSNREQKAQLYVGMDWATTGAIGGITAGGLVALGALAFLGVGYAKRHPDSKIAAILGPKPVYTSEFDEDAGSTDNLAAGKLPLAVRYPFIGRLKEWYQWESQRIIFLSLYAACNVGVALYGFFANYQVNALPYYPYAKACGKVLDFNMGFVLLPVLRNFMSFLRTTPASLILPLDHNLKIHRLAAYIIGVSSILHITMHYLDFVWLRDFRAIDVAQSAILNLSGFTGHIVTALMTIMFSTALIKRKIFKIFGRRYDGYTVFMAVHKLWIPIYALLWLHGQNFWPFSLWPLGLMFVEKYIQKRRARLDVTIVEAKIVGKDVLALKMRLLGKNRRFRFKAGQYLFLNAPDLAENEWHPFTITAAPEENFFSCHIRCRSDMDWTFQLRQRLGFADTTDSNGAVVPAINKPITEETAAERGTRLRVDGPYGSASEEVFEYDTVILVGAGIGVTPFISILKSISIRMKARSVDEIGSMSIYFYWICRDAQEFNSFQDVFDGILKDDRLSGRLEINSYTTGEINLKAITHEKYNQYAGKPNWNRIFKEKATKHSGEEIGVFLCGPNAIAIELSAACKTHTKLSGPSTAGTRASPELPRTAFKFHKEKFISCLSV